MKEIKEILKREFILGAIKNPLSILKNSFIRYLLIGVSTLTIDFGIYILLDKIVGTKEIVANLSSVFLSLFYNFYMTNYWTFKSGKARDIKKLSKYGLLATFNYIMNNLAFIIMHDNLGINGLITKAAITMLIVVWNFFLYKTWIFKTEAND